MRLQCDLPDTSPTIETAPVGSTAPYTRIPDAVLLDPRLTPVQFRIYAVIARRADREKATAFPSYATIAVDANISRTSAIKGVKALVALGYLIRQTRESGQGDATSNLYTLSGEGSQIYALPRTNSASSAAQAVQDLHHGSAPNAPQVVQDLHHGSANAAPELDSLNKKKSNKTQENRIAREGICEDSEGEDTVSASAAAANPELQKLLNDFQDNIGALTGMARQIVLEFAEKYGIDCVHEAIREAVIYEKRSLGYIRRILSAWRQNGRASAPASAPLSTGLPVSPPTAGESAIVERWWPPDLYSDLAPVPDLNDPAITAWNTISQQLPQLGRLSKLVTPVSLMGGVLTVRVSDARTHAVLTAAQRHFVEYVTRNVLGDDASIQVELIEQEAGAA